MSFRSILFDRPDDGQEIEQQPEPPCFADLHLDQLVATIADGREEYGLAPFFYLPLRDVEAVRYRHHVLLDLEQPPVHAAVGEFARCMRRMREQVALARKLHYDHHRQGWFLKAIAQYCDAVSSFAKQLDGLELGSRGFVAWRQYLRDYTATDAFGSLAAQTRELSDELARVSYAVHIRGNRVRVSRYEGEAAMTAEIEEVFAKFRRGATEEYRVRFHEQAEMNHVEAQILDRVARLYPETFSKLRDYCVRNGRYLDSTIGRFDREVQFYLGYLELCDPLKSHGLPFCYPRVSGHSKEVRARDAFDLALAWKLAREGETPVCNDFDLVGAERILVVTGPNQGGKTTFARMVGQLHYLASLGLTVPGTEARLPLADRVFTHFEREERLETLRGRFDDELVRIREILTQATGDSVLILNESFGSTTLEDALLVGADVIRQIVALESLCVFVTFVDELAAFGESTVSMVGMVADDDPAVRTYEVLRRPADGVAYAEAIAEKYGLTYRSLRRRVQ